MKRLLRSRLVRTLTVLIMLASASAISLSGHIIHSHASSSSSQGSWNIVPSPSPSNSTNPATHYNVLQSVSTYDASHAWAVGWYRNTDGSDHDLIEHWDGTNWSLQTGANPGASINILYGVKALSATNIWAVGYYVDANSNQLVLIEHSIDGGQTWSQDTNSYTGGGVLYGIDGDPSTGDAWAVGNVGSTIYTLTLHLVNGHFSQQLNICQNSDQNTDILLYSISEHSSSDVWAVGWRHSYFGGTEADTMHFDGSCWTKYSSPDFSNTGVTQLYGITAVAQNNAWAVGVINGSSAPLTGALIHWDGSEWSPTPISVGYALFSVASNTSNNIWAVGSYDGGTPLIYHSSDGGSNWDQTTNNNSATFLGVTFDKNSGTGWAVGAGNNANSLTDTLIEQYTPPLGGTWISPGNNFTITGNTLHFAAHAYGGAGVDHVNFTAWWPSVDPNNWYIPCQVTNPTPGTTDVYECDWNLTDGNAKAVLNGTLNVSFDVYDKGGNKILSPNGIHQGLIQRPVSLLAPFNKGDTFYVKKSLGGYHNHPEAGCSVGTFPDHCNNQLFGLDLVPDQQSDTTVLAPVGGIITGIPSDPNEFGCMQLMLYDGLTLNVCHFSTWTVTHGQQVVQGQVLGTRSSVHVHLSLDNRQAGKPYVPVPFNGAHTIEGTSLNPNHDGKGQTVTYAGQTFLVDIDEWQDWKGTSSN